MTLDFVSNYLSIFSHTSSRDFLIVLTSVDLTFYIFNGIFDGGWITLISYLIMFL
jgi:hypothetical protein